MTSSTAAFGQAHNMTPFFSIIVPCCDVEPYVRECLDSVLNQPFTDWECIIGVETSKDKTEEIVREYAAKDSRFRIFTGPRTGSCSASRNTGIDMATGEYIIFLDGDDTIVEGSLQRHLSCLQQKIDNGLPSSSSIKFSIPFVP